MYILTKQILLKVIYKNLTALLIVWYRESLHVQKNHLMFSTIPVPLLLLILKYFNLSFLNSVYFTFFLTLFLFRINCFHSWKEGNLQDFYATVKAKTFHYIVFIYI